MKDRILSALLALLAASSASCSSPGETEESSDLAPESVEVLRRLAGLGSYQVVPDGAGYIIVWVELAPGEETEQLYFASLDENGQPVAEPSLIKQVEDPGWTNLRLVPSPAGYSLWYWSYSGEMRVALLGSDGSHLATVDTGSTLYRSVAEIAVIGDTTALVWTNAYNQESFRLFNDQGTPRSEVVTFAGGEGISVVAVDDHFDVYRGGDGDILRSRYGLDGLIIGTEEVLASEATFLESPITHRLEGATLVAWKRKLDVGTGASFQYIQDDGGGWPESRILFGTNRLESLDLFLGAAGSTSFVGWESDATTALPELRLGQLDHATQSFSLTSLLELAPPENSPRQLRMIENDLGMALFFRVNDGPETVLMHRQIELP